MGVAKRHTINRAVVAAVAISAICRAATLHVPGDRATIQACIDAATGGDECVVAPGTYHETIDFMGKAIKVRSFRGAALTAIDGTGLGGSVVRCISNEGPSTVLDGFTVTGGTGTDLGSGNGFIGGGMYNKNSSPIVTNCTFTGNAADAGGGMYNEHGNPTIADCTFSGNTAVNGSGMFNTFSNPTVTACTFSGNTAAAGGAIANWFYSSPTVGNCTFTGNKAGAPYGYGGGIYNYNYSSPWVSNCIFNGNTAAYAGGGIYNYEYSSPIVTNCALSGNTAGHAGGGIYNNSYSNPWVGNCTLSGNTAAYIGGGMYNYLNCTPTLNSCIHWGNSPYWIMSEGASVPTMLYSDVQGGLPTGAVDGGGNINVDPMFIRPPDPGQDLTWDGVNDDYGDLRLQGGSDCINAGEPGSGLGMADLEGHARVLCGRVDMGAYEFGIGDYNCDQTVDLNDLAHWPSCMTDPASRPGGTGCEAFDFDGDGDIDLRDFVRFERLVTP